MYKVENLLYDRKDAISINSAHKVTFRPIQKKNAFGGTFFEKGFDKMCYTKRK